jgi:hypothetical protein
MSCCHNSAKLFTAFTLILKSQMRQLSSAFIYPPCVSQNKWSSVFTCPSVTHETNCQLHLLVWLSQMRQTVHCIYLCPCVACKTNGPLYLHVQVSHMRQTVYCICLCLVVTNETNCPLHLLMPVCHMQTNGPLHLHVRVSHMRRTSAAFT